VDLVTVASAIHWFDLNKFYTEVRRVEKPGGVIAAWTYYTTVFESAIDALIQRLVHKSALLASRAPWWASLSWACWSP
jgi:ubiquinone/menaquinone biosynthesis C-methylase UbiE